MASEDEMKDLREKNTELVQKVQYWKMTAAEKENEKLALMMENNELRLKLSRLRSSGGMLARKFEMSMQSINEKAVAHLVQASEEIAKNISITAAYMREREELDTVTPRWSAIGGTPKTERVHRVPPMMMGGQSIQPVVALSRTTLNTSSNSSLSRGTSQNRSVTQRALPMHLLQDVYIPLTRIDIGDVQTNSMDPDMETNNADDSTEELGLEVEEEQAMDDSNISEEQEFDSSRRLDVVIEDMDDEIVTPQRSRTENPLEGPSWLLDVPNDSREITPKTRVNLEPDSTTELEESASVSLPTTSTSQRLDKTEESGVVVRVSCSFSPTVRRRKRTSSPIPTPTPTPKATPTPRQAHYSPRPHASRRNSTSGRVLKVLVAKMRLEDEDSSEQASPPKRARSPSPTPSTPGPSPILPAARTVHTSPTFSTSPTLHASPTCDASPTLHNSPTTSPLSRVSSPPARPLRFDAPSPNGATDAGVIVSEARYKAQTYRQEPDLDESVTRDSFTSRNSRNVTRRDRRDSHRASKHENRAAKRESRAKSNESQGINSESRAINIESRAINNGSQAINNVSRAINSESQAINNVSRAIKHESRATNNDSRATNCESRATSRGSHESSDSGSTGGGDMVSEGRTRRPRKAVTYKEKPLNRKMRR